MSLTTAHGPLAAAPTDEVNYGIDGPEHRLLFDQFPRRVRAVFGGEIVLDTRNGMLLHETDLMPQLYVPETDVRDDLVTATDHSTHCPYKGDASYWSVRAGDRTAENAVWAYESPNEQAEWLRGYRGLDFEAMDAWFDEDEEIVGHLRDPYHRVDVRDTSRHIRVLVGDHVVAESHRPKVLSETGLPNRYYIPFDDVDPDLLEPSATHTACPYKGVASYYTLDVGGERIADAAWYYPHPLENAGKTTGHVCYLGDGVRTELDGLEAG
jgi:uncharacterized protein (DUF427 family)